VRELAGVIVHKLGLYGLSVLILSVGICDSIASGLRATAVGSWPLLNTSLPTEGAVRGELAKLQSETGLTLAWYEDGLHMVIFKDRSVLRAKPVPGSNGEEGAVSWDGTKIAMDFHSGEFAQRKVSLGVVQPDGKDLQEFPGIFATDICWSRDNSKLALTMYKPANTSLGILDLSSKLITNIVSNVDIASNIHRNEHFTSQCWSQDDKQIVYQYNGNVRILDAAKPVTSDRILTQGFHPTWSPDGVWIAFFDDNAYYAIRPNGDERRELFRTAGATSGLYWSPDSRVVAFVSLVGPLEGVSTLDAESYRLRVRHLQDQSEDWVAMDVSSINYQWVTNRHLLERLDSENSPSH